VWKNLYHPKRTPLPARGDRRGLGFIGVAVVIALFVWLLVRAYAIGRQAARLERPFAALVARHRRVAGRAGVHQHRVNMGVLPTKGLVASCPSAAAASS
jgi:cell division protein FtsW